MNRLTEKAIELMPSGLMTARDVFFLLGGTNNSRHAIVKRALASREVLRIRRGLYCLAPKLLKTPMDSLALAQHIYGPSYVSLETALAHHGWIPEAVHAVTSVCLKRPLQFDTPVGLFTYARVPQEILFADVERQSQKDGLTVFVAGPVKALADYVYTYRKDWAGIEPVIKSLRIDEEQLDQVRAEEVASLAENYRSRRVKRFLKGLCRDLRP